MGVEADNAYDMYAGDAESAATDWAEEYDRNGEYDILRRNGGEVPVFVRDEDGVVTCWNVYGESVPSYSAREVSP